MSTTRPRTSPSATLTREGAQRHTVRTLVVTQAVGGIGVSSAIAVAALLARDVSGSEQLAGLVQTGQVLGAAVAAAALAALMARRGRRPGLTLGYLIGAFGALLCIAAGTWRSFPLLLVGAVLLGAITASNNQSRYAAVDLAVPARRGRDLSTVVWATTIGSVLGPNLTGPGTVIAGWLHLPALVGPFVISLTAMLATAAFMAVRLRPDPLLFGRAHPVAMQPAPADQVRQEDAVPADVPPADATGAPASAPEDFSGAWQVIRHTPLVLLAVVAMALTYAVMVAVMVMTPIHMDHGGASLEVIGVVISAHVLGMYAFSPLVGMAVDRWGSPPLIAAGGLVTLSALVLAGLSAAGASIGLGVGLFLLGLGWSLGTVAASTMLTAVTPAQWRPQVQGAADLTTGFVAAGFGAVAGVVVGTAGYGWLNAGASVLAFGTVVVAVLARRCDAVPPPGPKQQFGTEATA